MTSSTIRRHSRLGTALAALALTTGTVGLAAPAAAQPSAARPSETLNLAQSTGTLVRLPAPMTDLFIANDAVADVQVRSNSQLYIFGKQRGETTVYATDKAGRVVYSANVRVGANVASVQDMLRVAMPEGQIQAVPMNNLVLLTGTVSSPDDAAEALKLTQAYVGEGTQVVSRLRSATPLQVNLKVRFAEVNRSALKQIGVNLLSRDTTGGFQFGIGQGDPGTNNASGQQFKFGTAGTTLAGAGRLFGLDLLATLNLAVNDGLASILAEPNLTALSGETASFLAGGEFPVPVSQAQGAVTVEFKQYGVGLAFTPIVLADGRISMRVRPEVSELSAEGSIKIGDFSIPALTTRRAETTVELGSGQSFMIAGLLRNVNTTAINKAPFLGDLPILGTLFRSSNFRRQETELVIIVTPYLVRPTSGRLALPTDGYRAPSDPELTFEGQIFKGVSGPRAVPSAVRPGVSASTTGAAATTAPAPGFKL
ncbi:type II and III secretion system protein family protein [uncultured Sphingomonas sp.]|uniref:type II and III secretion system protein family protein n=1 Tax=uncultured Sphingomonas sp. TaxID=158754 RepID=UPI0025EC1113|nr:type II and III secretion system protein family protein [uncultured Sphingomonas sp.]